MLGHQGVTLKGLGGVALLEEVCHGGWALRFQNHKPGPMVLSLDPDVELLATSPAPCLSCVAMLIIYQTSETVSTPHYLLSLVKAVMVMVSLHNNRTVNKTKISKEVGSYSSLHQISFKRQPTSLASPSYN